MYRRRLLPLLIVAAPLVPAWGCHSPSAHPGAAPAPLAQDTLRPGNARFDRFNGSDAEFDRAVRNAQGGSSRGSTPQGNGP